MGDGEQTPDDFARQQSASTGLPEHLCKANMKKNHFVLSNMDRILDALTRGLDLDILTRGYGVESRGVTVSYQTQAPVLGLVLPSNSPGVHTLWLPVIPMQVGLVLKPGPQEPWTPYRMAAAFFEAGVPREAISIYPGGGDIGAEVVRRARRSLIFGGNGDGGALQGRSARAGPRARLQQDPARRRRGGSLGEVSRHHGGQRLRQQRARMHQLLGHLGVAAHATRSPRRSRSESVRLNRNRRRTRKRVSRHLRFPEPRGRSGRPSRPTLTSTGVDHATGALDHAWSRRNAAAICGRR